MHPDGPVRICCFHRHPAGQPCPPDGRVMCCACFGRFTVAELARDEDGERVNVCIQCHRRERVMFDVKLPCCDYRDHSSGGPCTCPDHLRSGLHPFGYPEGGQSARQWWIREHRGVDPDEPERCSYCGHLVRQSPGHYLDCPAVYAVDAMKGACP